MNKAQVYEQQIVPLLNRIGNICEQFEIGMFAAFEGQDANGSNAIIAVQFCLPEGLSEQQQQALRVLMGGEA